MLDRVHPWDDYLRAVGTCIAKGWLTVLTPEHFEREARRLACQDIPEIIDRIYGPGEVDFTEAGFALHRLLLGEMRGPEWPEQDHSGGNWDEEHRLFDCYSTSLEEHNSLIKYVKEDLLRMVGRPATIGRVEGPWAIGPWKPNRFLTVPSGVHTVLHYELLDGATGAPSGCPASGPDSAG